MPNFRSFNFVPYVHATSELILLQNGALKEITSAVKGEFPWEQCRTAHEAHPYIIEFHDQDSGAWGFITNGIDIPSKLFISCLCFIIVFFYDKLFCP